MRRSIQAQIVVNGKPKPQIIKQTFTLYRKLCSLRLGHTASILLTEEGATREVPASAWMSEYCNVHIEEQEAAKEYYRREDVVKELPEGLDALMLKIVRYKLSEYKRILKKFTADQQEAEV
jgi:hypothetical protein